MSVAIVTGSGGLIGSEASFHFARAGMQVVGVDNDMRAAFFGADASIEWRVVELERSLGADYRHERLDIRDRDGIASLFRRYGASVELVIHAAAQPSHDWAASAAFTDFDINAVGTLNLLEAVRHYAPAAVFIFTSTNKVYGDRPNSLPLVELETRYEIDSEHTYSGGIREDMPIDQSLHSLFGVSKVAADILVQEYGRYFGLRTVCFRGGTLTGPAHSATELHGFLAYLMRCTISGRPYRVWGYKGKQVRDAIHSEDLISAFAEYFAAPRAAEVYNIGGGRTSNVSVVEGIELCQQLTGRELDWSYEDRNRVGDHLWWIGDNGRFSRHYPRWSLTYDIPRILEEIYAANLDRWRI